MHINMNKSLVYKNKFYLFFSFIFAFFLFLYLTYFLINGSGSILTYFKLKNLNISYSEQLNYLNEHNNLLIDKIKRLQPNTLDLDYLEEVARDKHNLSKPDENIIFDSYMIEDKDLKINQPRLLTVDNEVVVPVNKVVKVMITANDVLHAWALPSFGVKRDAVPGRINETWFKAEKVGTYYGQCSELCGIKHAFMPIEVRVVTEEEYQEWLLDAKVKFAKEINEEDQFKKLASK